MSDLSRFVIFMVVSAAAFIALLMFVTRNRNNRPEVRALASTTFVVVVLGMIFARYGHIFFRPPWWIYYGVPALVVFVATGSLAHEAWRDPAVCSASRFDGPCYSRNLLVVCGLA